MVGSVEDLKKSSRKLFKLSGFIKVAICLLLTALGYVSERGEFFVHAKVDVQVYKEAFQILAKQEKRTHCASAITMIKQRCGKCAMEHYYTVISRTELLLPITTLTSMLLRERRQT